MQTAIRPTEAARHGRAEPHEIKRPADRPHEGALAADATHTTGVVLSPTR